MSQRRPPLTVWEVACRWRQFEAEVRLNTLRVLAILILYAVHWTHYEAYHRPVTWLQPWVGSPSSSLVAEQAATLADRPSTDAAAASRGSRSERTHLAITCLVLGWIAVAAAVHWSLQERYFPRYLMYVTSLLDLGCLTGILTIATGPQSPLVMGYVLIIMMAGLRFDLRLIWCTTLTALCGYLFVLGSSRWPMGLLRSDPLPTVPRYQQWMVAACIALAGVLVGQWLRQVRAQVADLETHSKEIPSRPRTLA